MKEVEQIVITDEDLAQHNWSEIEAVKHNKVFLSLTKQEQDDVLETICENQALRYME